MPPSKPLVAPHPLKLALPLGNDEFEVPGRGGIQEGRGRRGRGKKGGKGPAKSAQNTVCDDMITYLIPKIEFGIVGNSTGSPMNSGRLKSVTVNHF